MPNSIHRPEPVSVPAAPRGRVVILGDSLAVYPGRDHSFPAHLQRRIDSAALPWTLTNAGINGDTTGGGARRLGTVLAPDARVLVVALGANDGLRGVDVPTVHKNLSSIVEEAQRHHLQVLLCGM